MDNIGEFAYLIIVALIFLAQTIFGKKKKSTANKRPQQNPKPAADPFEEIFGDFFGKEKEVNQAKPIYAEEKKEPEPFINEPHHEEGKVVSTEKDVNIKPYGLYTQRNQTYERKTESGLSFNSPALQVEDLDDETGIDLDLREAIIHQIIIERKFKP